jgi:hypothetical protein
MVARRTIMLISLLAFAGCTNLTEYDDTFFAGVIVLSSSDLSSIASMEAVEGARSICTTPDYVIVAATTGSVFVYDIETLQLLGRYAVGDPSSSGYFEIEYSSQENTVYLVGRLGNILELDVPGMGLRDMFSVCESPIDIEIADNKPYLYVACSSSDRLMEVRIENNGLSRSCQLEQTPVCMAIDQSEDSILVGTPGAAELVTTGDAGIIRRRAMDRLSRIMAVEAVPGDTVLCSVFDKYTGLRVGIILHYFPPYGVSYLVTGYRQLQGNTPTLCVDQAGSHAFVLTYTEAQSCSLVSYDCHSYTIDSRRELGGFPLDMDCRGGRLFVLTTQDY